MAMCHGGGRQWWECYSITMCHGGGSDEGFTSVGPCSNGEEAMRCVPEWDHMMLCGRQRGLYHSRTMWHGGGGSQGGAGVGCGASSG